MKGKKSILLFFVDGLGIGEQKDSNPLAYLNKKACPLAYFRDYITETIENGVMVPTDACLGVEGRPQSASGQTTILTGINAPQKIGYHKNGFPNEALKKIIDENSVFLQIKKANLGKATFANAYTPQFFTTKPRWKSATTLAVEAAGIEFRKLQDLLAGKALYHDFTNQTLRNKGFDIPLFTTSQAAEILARLTRSYDFVLYEHFITDKIGHAQDFALATKHLEKLAELLRELLKKVNLEETTVILTSDHGNIEDLSTRNHTTNKVPTVIWGREKDFAVNMIKSLTDITPTILKILEI
ncbi:MAG: alkaline phosphatase family protein [Pyrinomonadaceae bacterium]|nr:alkaline phosphatase family protein [Pyrinomonadaceae bacterium]MCX7640486.1 alkaline phosphatase family protein [Pyrinomonadaceae bacterium]MDW8305183.1 alkaline phosphatase family protein [Acidobacteriota bacterium]